MIDALYVGQNALYARTALRSPTENASQRVLTYIKENRNLNHANTFIHSFVPVRLPLDYPDNQSFKSKLSLYHETSIRAYFPALNFANWPLPVLEARLEQANLLKKVWQPLSGLFYILLT